jgi:hypothetical protein
VERFFAIPINRFTTDDGYRKSAPPILQNPTTSTVIRRPLHAISIPAILKSQQHFYLTYFFRRVLMNATNKEMDISAEENIVTLTDNDLTIVAGGNGPPTASKVGTGGTGKVGAGGSG